MRSRVWRVPRRRTIRFPATAVTAATLTISCTGSPLSTTLIGEQIASAPTGRSMAHTLGKSVLRAAFACAGKAFASKLLSNTVNPPPPRALLQASGCCAARLISLIHSSTLVALRPQCRTSERAQAQRIGLMIATNGQAIKCVCVDDTPAAPIVPFPRETGSSAPL